MREFKNYKYIWIILCLVAVFSVFSRSQTVEAKVQPPKVSAHAYVVMDANSGEILFSENRNKRIYPASTVKLMTAIVVMENQKLSSKIKIESSVLNKIPGSAAKIGLKAGNTYSVEQLLNLLLIVSAADAADTLAVATKGSTKDFIKQMNQRAKQLGLSRTSFDNTIGLDIGDDYNKTYSTAADIAKLARYAMSMKEIRNIVSKKTYTFPARGIINNTNQFYSKITYNTERYSIIGTKTGSTNAAGSVLVSTARDQQGHEIICAFFGNKSRVSTYEDTRKLLDYAFQCQDTKQLSLSLSYYDVRYRESESAIMQLSTAGILTMPESGEFSPAQKVKQGTFVDTINQICNTKLKAIKKKEYITVNTFADILYESYPIKVSEDKIQKSMGQIEVLSNMAQEDVPKLIALFDAQILPVKYYDDINRCITKEDMVLIAVKLKDYINTLAEEETEEIIDQIQSMRVKTLMLFCACD
ncbi:MAG: serine hydrolase [Mobilitalea sp.]